MLMPFTQKVIKIIKAIPPGKVMTYGRIAYYAGKTNGARQVSRFLHVLSAKHELPWHRVINAQGRISLKPSNGYELQKALLEDEGIVFSLNNTIDLEKYLWIPDQLPEDEGIVLQDQLNS